MRWYEAESTYLASTKNGWYLVVEKENLLRVLASQAWESFLELIGEPCCGKGIWRYLGAYSDWAGHYGYRMLQWTGKLRGIGEEVIRFPVEEESRFGSLRS